MGVYTQIMAVFLSAFSLTLACMTVAMWDLSKLTDVLDTSTQFYFLGVNSVGNLPTFFLQ